MRTDDLMEICQLLARYAVTITQGDIDGLLAVFTADGFTAEHGLHRHVRRALVLDGLLGSARELTREAGLLLRREGCAPRLADLVT